MTNSKQECTTSKASKSGCTTAEGSGKKLAEDFLAALNRSCEQHGSEFLDRMYAERPQLYFKALVKLTQVLDSELGQPMGDFGHRQQVIQRLTRCDD
jgi:hypothetical protein